MKRLTKFYALLLAVILALTPILQPIVEVSAFKDVAQESENLEAIEALTALGLLKGYEDGTFKPQGTITRAEFSAVITRALGLAGVQIVQAETIFTDVPSSHWASGYIKMAADLGIIVGFGDGIFKPDAPVTYEQAVKMIVASLGYEPLANHRGGYPAGYLTIANEKKITDKVNSGIGQPALREIVAKLMFNSLEVPTYEPRSIGSTSYIENSDKTFLSTGLSTVKVEGAQVDGNEHTKLDSAVTNLGEDEVEIGGIKYKVGTTKAKDYFGQRVTYYYKKDNSSATHTLIMISPERNKNERIIIKADEIIDASPTRVEYYIDEADNKKETVTVSSNASFIWNGKYFDGNTKPSLNISSGKLELLDSNADGSYDVVFVDEYRTMVVGNSPSTYDYTILDKYNSPKLILDSGDRNIRISILRNGVNDTFASIRNGNVLSVSESLNTNGKKLIKVLISTATVSGSVTETGGDNEIYVAGKKYNVSQYYVEKKGMPNLGDSGTFYLDADGKIANISLAAERGTNYAYLVSAEKSTSALSSNTLRLKLYIPPTSGKVGTFKTFECHTRVRVDGSTMDNHTDIENRLLEAVALTNKDTANPNAKNKDFSQVIKYAVNSSGKIDILDTLYKEESEPTESLMPGNTPVQLKYESANNKLVVLGATQAQIVISSSTRFFFVPGDRTNEDDYGIKDTSYFKDGQTYFVEGFDLTSSSKLAKVLVIYGVKTIGVDSDTIIDQYTPVVAVDSSTKTQNAAGNTVVRLKYYLNGNNSSHIDVEDGTTRANEVQALEQGDMIRFSKNGAGLMKDLDVLFRIKSLSATKENIKKDGYYEAVFGAVYSRDTDNSHITVYTGPSSTVDYITANDLVITDGTSMAENQLRSYGLTSSAKYYDIDSTRNTGKIFTRTNASGITLVDYEESKEKPTLVFLYIYDRVVRAIFAIKR